jgi:hypothetical protein
VFLSSGESLDGVMFIPWSSSLVRLLLLLLLMCEWRQEGVNGVICMFHGLGMSDLVWLAWTDNDMY